MPGYWLIFLGGGTGAVCRFFLGNAVMRGFPGAGFPFGTLAVNLLGAFLIGAIMEAMALKFSAPEPWRLLLVTGFLGGFTTFSAFSLETALMLQRGDYGQAALYSGASVAGTVALVLLAAWGLRQIL